ncbi:uncharacterized protein IL334_005366 [Kwoniella shivajii]|uniref:Uncharacterized protein n=1 Tax=Kwoniella shivajii TaxID=564305 RepID=A0ABZ1D4U1_9TREE|nr:hypothetical protein IL334_005366 [Kwoniella shivajii]
MFAKYFAILTTLTVLISASPTDSSKDGAGPSNHLVSVNVRFSPYSKFINQMNPNDTFFGDGNTSIKSFHFTSDVNAPLGEWDSYWFNWVLYDKKANLEKLQDTDIL